MLGCAAKLKTIPGVLDLNYKPQGTQGANQNFIIAAVTPNFKYPEKDKVQNNNQFNPFMGASYGSSSTDFNDRFKTSDEKKFASAMDSSIKDILMFKGFVVEGPIESFDDLSYTDKKKFYLAIVPHIDIDFVKVGNNIDQSSSGTVTETGTLTIQGEIKIDFLEPLTREKFVSKRINLTDLKIQTPYIIQKKGVPNGSFGTAASLLGSGKELIDDSDKAIADALNIMFGKVMAKIDNYISSEEIASYKDQVDNLKGLKRF